MSAVGLVADPDLLFQDASGIQEAGLHGGIGLVVDVPAAEVELVQRGRFERKWGGCCDLVRSEWLVSVDDVVRGRVDLVKMDVEGHEPAALRGMKDLIRVHQPVILSEVNEYWLRTCSGTSARGYVDSLIDMGYEVYPAERPDQPIRAGTLNLEVLDAIDVIAVPARMRARDGAGLGAVLAPVG